MKDREEEKRRVEHQIIQKILQVKKEHGEESRGKRRKTRVFPVWLVVDSQLFPQWFPSGHSELRVLVLHELSGFFFPVLSGLSFVLGAFTSNLLYLLN
ncbi:uncharacterized [Tachysurus ichikawai]